MDEKFDLRDGSSGDAAFAVVVTPERAGWAYRGLRVLKLEPAPRGAAATVTSAGGHKLIAVEALTPGRNWSSIPARTTSRVTVRSSSRRSTASRPWGLAYQRLYGVGPESTQKARAAYVAAERGQRLYL